MLVAKNPVANWHIIQALSCLMIDFLKQVNRQNIVQPIAKFNKIFTEKKYQIAVIFAIAIIKKQQ